MKKRQRRQRHASYPCLPCLGIISLLLSHSLETVPCAFKLFFVTDYLKGFFSWEQPFIYTRPNTQWHISLYYQVLNHSLLSFSSKCPVYGNNNNNIERANWDTTKRFCVIIWCKIWQNYILKHFCLNFAQTL